MQTRAPQPGAPGQPAAAEPQGADDTLAHTRVGVAETEFRAAASAHASGADDTLEDGATRLRPASSPASSPERQLEDPAATRLRAPGQVAADVRGAASSGASGSGWGDPAQWAQGGRPLQPGDVVKDRFVLEQIIGKGGMGVVFRVRDLRKEEAQDRHPYAALKVLNEAFKRHPESLKALQREARKAQNLAHPNIVTVYDFDRDGANVYIVMELLEGEPLDRTIERLKGRGLPFDQALPIIRALCGALSYAHQHGVVHSDFKPANAYVARNGVIKVFDFGIARAAKHQGELAAGSELTLFDAGTLGALTPAYASCEMIDGLEPDPRDDIYALGCVTYELVTGSHPFDRRPATQARELKLQPKPVRGLSSRQWRALRRALAFEREARSTSVEQFLQEISPQPRSLAPWIGAAAIVLLLGAAATLWLPGYLKERRVAALAAEIRDGTPQALQQALPELQALAEPVRASMLLDEGVRTALLRDFTVRIEAVTDDKQQRYDYPRAEQLLRELQRLLPDSQAVSQIGETLTARKNDEIKRQSDRFDDYLRKGWLVAAQNSDNIASVRAVIAQIDPQHPLLADPRLPSAYAEQAQVALQRKDIALAQALTKTGLEAAPRDGTLQDLNDAVARELDAQQRASRLASLRRKLTDELPTATALAQFDAVHDDLALLQMLEPQNASLARARDHLQQLLERQLSALLGGGSVDQAQQTLAQYADLTQPSYVDRQRRELDGVHAKLGDASAVRTATIAKLKAGLDALISQPESSDTWDSNVNRQLAQLSAYLPSTDAYSVTARRTAATQRVTLASTLRSQGRLSEAERFLQLAGTHMPELASIAAERQRLADVRAAQDARDQQQKRLAELAALKQKLLDQATANDVTAAGTTLRDLRAGLASDDPFLGAAPKAIAGAYVRLAAIDAREKRFEGAMTLIDKALELDRTHAQALAARQQYVKQLSSAAAAKIEPAATSQAASAAPSSPTPADSATAPSTPVAATTGAARSLPEAGAPGAQTGTVAAAASAAPAGQATANGAQCRAALAGYGSRSRGVCFDMLPTGRGPELVVVPAGTNAAKPFAIGRYEISANDFNAYCQQADGCNPVPSGDLPVTSIAAAQAVQYAQWLSSITGFNYRLPTEAEWTYAASAAGGGERDFNCVVEINGQKIRGFGLASVRAGRSNAWGLYNLVGNAQEWVSVGGGWSARGGAYSDPISQCGVGLSRPSVGAADPTTGFRLVRELR